LIRSQPDIEVVGEAEDAVGAVRLTRELQPDIVVLDINMPPGDSGLQVIGEVLETGKSSKVLVLTMYDDPTYLQAAIGAGALGYVVKAAADEELISAIRILYEGRTFFSVSQAGNGADEVAGQPLDGLLPELSRRECQVLYYVAHGFTSQQIADQLGLSIKTVDGYRSRIMEKLGLRDRASLVRFALRKGILHPDRPLPRSL
jgi:two-component system response regulator NreC